MPRASGCSFSRCKCEEWYTGDSRIHPGDERHTCSRCCPGRRRNRPVARSIGVVFGDGFYGLRTAPGWPYRHECFDSGPGDRQGYSRCGRESCVAANGRPESSAVEPRHIQPRQQQTTPGRDDRLAGARMVDCPSLRATRQGGGGLNHEPLHYAGSFSLSDDLAVPYHSSIRHRPIRSSSEKARNITTTQVRALLVQVIRRPVCSLILVQCVARLRPLTPCHVLHRYREKLRICLRAALIASQPLCPSTRTSGG